VSVRSLPLDPVPLLVASWGVVGVLLLLGQALFRLTPVALEPLLGGGMTPFQAACYIAWVVANAYLEGYRGFQKRFSPRVVARAVHLSKKPRPLFVALAPLFCMSFFHSTRRGKAMAWGILILVVVLVTLVRHVPQPWRGIIDGGVVVGLLWGALAIVLFFLRAVLGKNVEAPEDLPGGTHPSAARSSSNELV
jgi:uncharacterized membrane protein YesL